MSKHAYPGFAEKRQSRDINFIRMIQLDKKDLWPEEGKLKKGLIIFTIVVVAALLITLVEEKTNIKLSNKATVGIALACTGVWIYKPLKKKNQ